MYAVNFLTGQSRTGGQLNADPYCNAGICVALLGRGFDQPGVINRNSSGRPR